MNKEFNKEAIRNFYLANKALIVPILSILGSLALFFVFILPQITSVPAKKTQLDTETLRLNKLKEYEALVNSADVASIEKELQTLVLALPVTKEFENILSAISQASGNSGAQLVGYSYQEGSGGTTATLAKFPSINFSLGLQGSPEQVSGFIKELYRTYPISEVTSLKYSPTSSELTVIFYYKPLPQAENQDRENVKEASPKQRKTLETISSWNTLGEFVSSPQDASAASDLSPFE